MLEVEGALVKEREREGRDDPYARQKEKEEKPYIYIYIHTYIHTMLRIRQLTQLPMGGMWQAKCSDGGRSQRVRVARFRSAV